MNFEKELGIIIADLNAKKFEQVIVRCENIIKLNLGNSIIYNIYGVAHQNLNKYKESIEAFNKSIQLQNNNFAAINNLALSLKSIKNFKHAEKMFNKCLKIKPDYVVAIINYANLKRELSQYDHAIKLFLKSLNYEEKINKLNVYFNLAELYRISGDFKKANKYAKIIVKENPENVYGHKLLSDFIDYRADSDHLHKMESIFNKNDLKNPEKIELAFVIGKVYEKIKKYDIAFKYFKTGNDLKKTIVKYNYSDHLKLHNNIIKVFDDVSKKKIVKNKTKQKVIFVCGMPRSGTTLVEQIISSHPEVSATGENNIISSYINKNYLRKFDFLTNKVYEDFNSNENFLQKEYLDLLYSQQNISNVYTDKTVQNFLWIGFINIFFPNSKTIITERNAKDICLSIYKINFQNGFMNFAYDQKNIAKFYNLYFEIIDFWKKNYPKKLYIVNYEKLVDDPSTEIRKIIKFCDLKWDNNCLKHYENKSPINTASITQARKPIYKSSKNFSDNYSFHLKEMFDHLKN
tara:strand:+ start:1244 stop:2797 length:1554 start_codon:yes stop_codon:yes gene_type:complete